MPSKLPSPDRRKVLAASAAVAASSLIPTQAHAGFAVDLVCRGNVRDFIAVHLGEASWRDVVGSAVSIEGDQQLAKQLPRWLRLDRVLGRDLPLIRPAA